MPEHLSEIILVLFTASLSNAVSMFQIQQVHSQSFEQDPLKRLLTRCKCNWMVEFPLSLRRREGSHSRTRRRPLACALKMTTNQSPPSTKNALFAWWQDVGNLTILEYLSTHSCNIFFKIWLINATSLRPKQSLRRKSVSAW